MRRAFLPVAALLTLASVAGALDLGVGAWVGNYGFARDRAISDTTLPGADWLWGPSVTVTQHFSDTLALESGFRVDPIMRNVFYTLFTVQEKILSIGAGPFFGLFNGSPDFMQPGISTAVRLEIPGIAFLSLQSDSSIAGNLVAVGDYTQERAQAGVGFYVRNAVCTLELDSSTFTQRADASTLVVDGLTAWSLRTDVFMKNVPYRVGLSAAWQTLDRSWIAATTTRHTLHSLVIGAELAATIARTVTVVAGIDGTVYSFATGATTGSSQDFLFRASTGVTLTLE